MIHRQFNLHITCLRLFSCAKCSWHCVRAAGLDRCVDFLYSHGTDRGIVWMRWSAWLYIPPHPSDGPSVHARSAIIITPSLSAVGWDGGREEREADDGEG